MSGATTPHQSEIPVRDRSRENQSDDDVDGCALAHEERQDESGEECKHGGADHVAAAAHRTVRDTLDGDGCSAGEHHRDGGSEGENADQYEASFVWILTVGEEGVDAQKLRTTEQRSHRADHEDFGVGKVDEPQHAVDEGVAERDERVDRAERKALDRQIPERLPEQEVRHRYVKRPGA